MAITALLKVAGFTNNMRYVDIAHQALVQMQFMMSQYPLGFGQWLLRIAQNGYQPYQIVAVGASDSEIMLPAFQDHDQLGDRATAYVRASFACQVPVADPDELRALLGRQEAGSRASDEL